LTQVRQYYDASGVPFQVPSRPADVVSAWRSHRQRFRRWFADLPADRWSDPTRCSEWTVTDMAQHLISGAQFLGYTLHQAAKGEPTQLLKGFDAQATPAMTTAQWGGHSTDQLLTELDAMDSRLDKAIDALADGEWRAWAEAPPGKVAAYLSINHFLFDSWVHERDVMLPALESPVTVAAEASCVASYALALAGVAGVADDDESVTADLLIRLSDLDQDLRVVVGPVGSRVTVSTTETTPEVTTQAGPLVDTATGRPTEGPLLTDELETLLSRLATAMG
jgi:uncharacterized protein (TIGR03083 family)